MKTIGLIGGLSHESTLVYYKHINELIRQRLGDLNAAKILLDSLNFQEVTSLLYADKWDELDEMMINSALKLEKAGADCIMIATNSIHPCAPAIKKRISVPFLHITDATA